MAIVAADELVKVFKRYVTGTVPALDVTVTALFTSIRLLNLFWPVNVCVVPNPATVAVAAGNVIVVLSVPANVIVLLIVAVFPSAMVNVALVAGAVIVTLLMLVAVATPIVGVASVGDVARTILPEPVVVLPNAVTVPLVGNVSVVVPVAVNVVENAPDVASVDPSARVSVALVVGAVIATLLTDVAVAIPIVGVVSVGEVAKTTLPEPVVAKFPSIPELL
jgi:hypothetical protein